MYPAGCGVGFAVVETLIGGALTVGMLRPARKSSSDGTADRDAWQIAAKLSA